VCFPAEFQSELNLGSNWFKIRHFDETAVQADVTYNPGNARPRADHDSGRYPAAQATEASPLRLAMVQGNLCLQARTILEPLWAEGRRKKFLLRGINWLEMAVKAFVTIDAAERTLREKSQKDAFQKTMSRPVQSRASTGGTSKFGSLLPLFHRDPTLLCVRFLRVARGLDLDGALGDIGLTTAKRHDP
jgi:hypothetical protein